MEDYRVKWRQDYLEILSCLSVPSKLVSRRFFQRTSRTLDFLISIARAFLIKLWRWKIDTKLKETASCDRSSIVIYKTYLSTKLKLISVIVNLLTAVVDQ